MKKKLSLLLSLILLGGCMPINPATPAMEASPPPSLSYEDEDFQQRFDATAPSEEALESLWDFSVKTFEPLRKEENRFYSPLSLYLALSMLEEGALEESLRELQGVLGQEVDIKALLEHLSYDTENMQVLIANSLWIQEDFSVKEDFREKLIKDHYASVYQLDLQKQESMDKISSWIAENTKDRIKPKLSPAEMVRLYLVNTLYLKSSWLESFNEEATKEDVFYGLDKEINHPFMHQEGDNELYVENEILQLARKTLRDGMEMYFVLPREGYNLSDIDYESIPQLMKEMDSSRIKWTMPKIHIEDEMELTEVLRSLGVKQIFEEDGKLGNISDDPLQVSLIKQWTDLLVEEKGVEAAAATMIEIKDTSLPPEFPEVEMKLDRPFSLFITFRDLPLFFGDVYQP